jgi:hypothetical protein
MRQQKIIRNDKKKSTIVHDDRKRSIPELEVNPLAADIPVRAVFYVEVGDMDQLRVQLLVSEVTKLYTGLKGGVHYVIPVRHGKIGSDIVFEEEFMRVVNEVCEIHKGEIRLKDGAQVCHVVRQQI